MWPNNIAGLGWMPWVILWSERAWNQGGRAILIGVVVGAHQMLTGAPEIILFTWIIAGTLLVGQWWAQRAERGVGLAVAGRWVLMGFLVAGVCAVQLFPFGDFVLQSHRDANYDDNAWSMPGWGWANFLVPLFHCTPALAGVYSQDAQQWTSSYYVGIGVLALAILAIVKGRREGGYRVWVLAGITLVSLIMALGQDSFIFASIKSVFPWLGFVRFPVKFVVMTVLAVPLLAAFGLRYVLSSSPDWKPAAWIGATMAVLIGFLVWFAEQYPVPDENPETTFNSGLSRALFLGVILVAGHCLSYYRSRRGYLTATAVLLAFVGYDGISHTPKQNPSITVQALEPGIFEEEDDVPKAGADRAMISPRMRAILGSAGNPDLVTYALGYRRASFPNWNLIEHVAMPDGFYSLYFKEQQAIWRRMHLEQQTYPPRLADFLGVTRVTSDTNLFRWDPRTNAMALVSSGQQPKFVSEDERVDYLSSDTFEPRREAVFDPSLKPLLGSRPWGRATIDRIEREPGIWRVSVTADQEALVLVAQTFAPGWEARVDGRKVPVWAVNHAFQAVAVPSGTSALVLEYRERTFFYGAGLSIVILVLILGFLPFAGPRRGQSGVGQDTSVSE